MYYLLISFISLGALTYLESKRIKFGKEKSFLKTFQNNFKLINFIFIPIAFVSIFMIMYILLRSNNFIQLDFQIFKLSHIPYILYSICTVPIIEEYFYRFFPYSFKRFNNIFIYIFILIISSLIFTYAHQVGLYESVIIFIIAVVLSIIYLVTKNISYTIICHSLYNLLVIIYSYINIGNIIFYLVIFGISFLILIINKHFRVKL